MTRSNLKELKKLHDLGFSLIWLYPKQKRPVGNQWTSGPRKTWEELKAQYQPSYNVGVRLGETSKIGNKYLCCIDVDVEDPTYKKEALNKLKELTHDAQYPTVLSGSGHGSRHLYCLSDHPFKMVQVEKHKNKWEICVYSTGRQMVLPPSIHPNGKSYAWRDNYSFNVLPKLPEGIFGLRHKEPIRAEDSIKYQAVEVDLYTTKLSIPMINMIETGENCQDRSASLLAIAMSMCRVGFTDNEILSVLSDENNWIGQAALERRGSRSGAVDWLGKYVLTKARFETNIMRRFENKPELERPSKKEIALTAEQIANDIDAKLPDLAQNGNPKATLRNVVHILEYFMEQGLVGYDDFANRAVFLKDTVYGGVKGCELTDDDDLRLMHYIACHYRFEPSQDLCFKAHALISKKYHFHPVRRYLENVKWDGGKRIDTWLQSAFNATGPKEYLEAVSRKVLVAAVKRVFEPGCKFDYVMVLEGHQGKGKSTALAALASAPWFTDSLGDIHQKDVVDQMTGKWLIEMAELASIRKVDIEPVKAFLSRQVDRVRPPYGRRSMDFPRQSIFIGSTNNSEYFSDETGNRRFWPVKIDAIKRKWLRVNRDQLWAEALYWYQQGETTYLTPELEEVAKREQEKRFEVDEWESEIKKIVLKSHDDWFTTTQLWRAIHITNGDGYPNTPEGKRIGKIMHRLGFDRGKIRIDGIQTKCWKRR